MVVSRLAEAKGYTCDMCGAHDARRYNIKTRGVPEWSVDLCASCGGVIDSWHNAGRPPAPKQKRRKPSKTILPKQH